MMIRTVHIILLLAIINIRGEYAYAKSHQLVQKAIKALESSHKINKKKVKDKKEGDKEEEGKEEGEKKNEVTQAIATEEKTAPLTGLQQAKNYIDQAIKDPAALKEASTWYYRGVIYDKLMRENMATDEASHFREEALKSYRKVQNITKKTSQYHSFSQVNIDKMWNDYLDRGRRYYRQEAYEQAITQFKICQQIESKDLFAPLYRAIATHQDEQFEAAHKHYEAYLALGGKAPAAYIGMATITHNHFKDSTKALDILNKAMVQYPFNSDLIAEQLRIYIALEQRVTQERVLEQQVYTANSSHGALYYQLGYWYEERGNSTYAIPCYQKAIELAPDELAPIRQLGLLHYNEAVSAHKAMGVLIKKGKKQTHVDHCILYKLFELAFQHSTINKPLDTTYIGQYHHKKSLIQQYPIYIHKGEESIYKYYLYKTLYDTNKWMSTIHRLHTQNVIAYTLHQTYCTQQKYLKKCLEQTAILLKKGQQINKDDVVIAKCLYSTYYRLNKDVAAKNLVAIMRKKGYYFTPKEDLLQVEEVTIS